MRLIAFVLVAFIVSGPAAAQTWKDYSYPDYSFAVMFPADPQIETTTYQVADGRSVPARIYSVRRDNNEFKVTVADLANAGLQESAVIDHAVRMLSQGGEVKVDFPHRIYQVYGRQLSVLRPDGSRTAAALFQHNGRLYQVEGIMRPGGSDTDMIQFQQSLVFERNSPNRSEETIRAIREACRGVVNNPAGLDDPRCARQ